MIEELKVVDEGRNVDIYGITDYAKGESIRALRFAYYLGKKARDKGITFAEINFCYYPRSYGSSIIEGDFSVSIIMSPEEMAGQLIDKLIEHRARKAEIKEAEIKEAKERAEFARKKVISFFEIAEKESKTRAEFSLFDLERAKKERKERIISALINEPIIDTKPPDALTAVNLSIDHWKRIRAFVEVATQEKIVERFCEIGGHVSSNFCGLCKYFHIGKLETDCGSCLSVIDAGCKEMDSPWKKVNIEVCNLKVDFDRERLLRLVDEMLKTLGKYRDFKERGSFSLNNFPYNWCCPLPDYPDYLGDDR